MYADNQIPGCASTGVQSLVASCMYADNQIMAGVVPYADNQMLAVCIIRMMTPYLYQVESF
jgi:hypothetical protein